MPSRRPICSAETPPPTRPEIMITSDSRSLSSLDSTTSHAPVREHPLTAEHQHAWLKRLYQHVADRIQAEQQAAEKYRAESAAIERDFEVSIQQRTETHERERSTLQAEFDKAVIDAGTEYAHDYSAAKQEFDDVLAAVQQQATTDTDAVELKHEEDQWMVLSYFDEEAEGSPKQQFDIFRSTIEKSREQLQLATNEIEIQKLQADSLMRRRRQDLEVAPPEPEKATLTTDLDAARAQFHEACETVRSQLLALKRLRVPALFGGPLPFVLAFGAWALLFGITGFAIDPAVLPVQTTLSRVEWLVICGLVMLFPVVIAMWILLAIGRGQSSALYVDLFEQHVVAQKARLRWDKLANAELKQREDKFLEWQRVVTAKRDGGMKKADHALAATLQRIEHRRDTEFAAAQRKYPALLDALTQRRDQLLRTAETDYPQRLEKLKTRFEWDLDRERKRHDQAVDLCSKRFQAAWRSMAERWLSNWQEIENDAAEMNRLSDDWFRDWETLGRNALKLPSTIPPAIRLGMFEVNLAAIPQGLPAEPQLVPERTTLTLPVCLPFPERPSLLLKVADEGRSAAARALQNTMLRLLTTLPGGKVRFTILDPVGLGDNFAAFMHLADYDELMITSRIWTEQSHIEQRLVDLTEHMENVFQKYLRNEFRSIQEYNEHAGEVAEPYQVLVVANFPANFSDNAARRLVSIAQSGPRCGVFVLASVDTKLRLPLNFDLKDLESNATVFDWIKADGSLRDPNLASPSDAATLTGFATADPELRPLPLRLDAPPEPDLFTRLVKAAGHESKDARRVEVAFERIAPKDSSLWMSDSRGGLDVPLGRAGATKLQHLRLGKGTSQHVLVAGKTGSGKSTFLHILITNAALHYGPDQVQFYLIDFKKGVEFKTYATHELPHARVIAIESDREFGVSVLERLDGVLKERGDIFRDLGVQDIASFRAARPDQPMPRILLVVDEFQEFFVEDDKHSQTAALLLDRLVRQGRAFGIHVLLGSQTLGGAYSLARSTLGQMAVRIALQCSESDAHLILSEDNTAARLLTRPGEAIYNDANGLMEGNHPFQIAWLDDDRRDVHLGRVQELMHRRGVHVPPAIVFEGNIPADPRRNSDLRTLIETPLWEHPLSEKITWLGEAVAIKDPTAVSFRPQGGQNLLVVGQNEPAVIGLLATSLISLACQMSPRAGGESQSEIRNPKSEMPAADGNGDASDSQPAPQFIILDGNLGEGPSIETWRRLKETLPHDVRLGDPHDVPAVLSSLSAELACREQAGAGNESPIFLVLFNLGRFRDLRKADDDFGFGGFGGEKKVSPSKQFADLLKNGPGLGLHTLAWSDTYNNVSRWFSSQTLREFELRIVFQMSPSDSSNLIDTPLAGKLGTNRAILHLVDQGSNEKFRPYGPPPAEWLTDIARRWQGDSADQEVDTSVPVGEDLSQFTIL